MNAPRGSGPRDREALSDPEGGHEEDDDETHDVDGEELGPIEAENYMELDVDVGAGPQVMPMVILWRSDDGSAHAAVPGWALAGGDSFAVRAEGSMEDDAVPEEPEIQVKFVTISAELLARARPSAGRATPWDRRWPTAWPQAANLMAAGGGLVDPPQTSSPRSVELANQKEILGDLRRPSQDRARVLQQPLRQESDPAKHVPRAAGRRRRKEDRGPVRRAPTSASC